VSLDETELPEPMFEVVSPLNITIHTSTWHWFQIRLKHPDHKFIIDDVVNCISKPDIIKRSRKDDNVFLSYRNHNRYILVAVCKKINGLGFLMTVYLTDKIKEGELLWQKLK